MDQHAAPGDPGEDVLNEDVLDEEALRWEGDEETGRAAPRLPGRDAATGRGPRAEVADGELEGAAAGEAAGPPRRPGLAAITLVGAVLYLALTIAWVLAVGYTSAGTSDLWAQLAWQFGEFTAILAAPLWFGTTVLLTPWRVGARAVWLAVGLAVLLPWPLLPLVMVGGAA